MNTKQLQKTKILLIDDEPAMAETLGAYVKKEQMDLEAFLDGEAGLEAFGRGRFDLVIVDWMLPGISGPEIVRKIRESSNVPILMISARDGESDVILGLELGADDYITKPFGTREVIARIKSLLRRTRNTNEVAEVQIGNINFSPQKGEIWKDAQLVKLTPNELRIFKVLFENLGMIVSREQLMEEALGYHDFLNDRTLDTHVKNLRRKLEENHRKPRYIVTVRELGFKLCD